MRRERRNSMKTRLFLMAMVAALLVSLLAFDAPAMADPSAISGLAQGDDFLVSHAASLRSMAAVAYNDDLDEYLIVWTDARASTSYADIYGQIVSSAGVPRGDNFVIRDEASNYLVFPDVAYDTNNGRYLVVWEDNTEKDVEGQLLDQDGAPYGTAFNIMDGTSGDPAATPAVAFHPPTSTYFVVYRRGVAGDYNIQGKRVSATGTVAANDYNVSIAAGDQTDPDVSVNPATGGDFLVVWEDGRAAVDQIYGCLFYDTTWFLGSEFVVSTHATEARYDPAVAFSPDAQEWLVAFERDTAGDYQIVGRRVTTAGATIGSNFGICGDAGDQADPTVVYNTDNDEFLVAWEDYRGGASADIYGRRVESGGGTAGNVFAINTTPDSLFAPVVAASPAAPGYLVVSVELSPSFVEDIVGQRIGTSGTLEGPRFVISAPVGDQRMAATAYNSQDSEYLVIWQDARGSDLDIWGQRVDADGTLLSDNFVVSSATGNQVLPDVAYNLDTNQYLVVWEDRRADADIYGQLLDADGGLNGAELQIAGAGATARRRPRIAYNPISGEFLVVYVYESENNNIRGRRLGVSGAPLAPEIDIATGTTDQNYPDLACRTMEPGGGGYLVAWRDTDGAQRDVKGQRLNPSGGLLEGVLDICVEASSQWSPAVAYSPDDDRYLVIWPDDRDNTSQGRNVYGRQVGGGGALFTEFAISSAAGNQSAPAVTYGSGPGNYVASWEDTRNAGTTPDIYAQRVSSSGVLVDTTANTNDPLFVYSGNQESPAVAWSSDGMSGLVAWEDGRNGESFHIYALRLTATASTGYQIFLPVVVRND
jgi:hypothetical protein